jgi:hypothetical protein
MASLQPTLEQNTATPDEILGIADKIWIEVKKRNLDVVKDSDKVDLFLEDLQNTHSEFATSFPIVLKWMVQLRKYNKDVFRKHLLSLGTNPIKSMDDFIERQATYIANIEKHYNPTHNDKEFKLRKKMAYDSLKNEFDSIEKEENRKAEENKNLKEEIKQEQIAEIIKLLQEANKSSKD